MIEFVFGICECKSLVSFFNDLVINNELKKIFHLGMDESELIC